MAAGVAVSIFSKFYPAMADSVNRMARQLMKSRITAGVAFPSDVRAGFELGKKIAELEIEKTKDFVCTTPWDGKVPSGPQYWRGRFVRRNRRNLLQCVSLPRTPIDRAKVGHGLPAVHHKNVPDKSLD